MMSSYQIKPSLYLSVETDDLPILAAKPSNSLLDSGFDCLTPLSTASTVTSCSSLTESLSSLSLFSPSNCSELSRRDSSSSFCSSLDESITNQSEICPESQSFFSSSQLNFNSFSPSPPSAVKPSLPSPSDDSTVVYSFISHPSYSVASRDQSRSSLCYDSEEDEEAEDEEEEEERNSMDINRTFLFSELY